jgi:RHS repeat-associated protein
LSAKGTSSSETAWSPALTDFNEVLVGLGQKPLDTASLKLPTLAAYYPETATAKSSNPQAESTISAPRILFWYHPDYLGNVDLITERDGFAHEFFMYNPWGEEMHQWNANTYAFTSPYRFNAKELDPETGLAYYGARYYQNKLGMWLSVDPLAHEYPSLMPNNFCANNPMLYVDPNGSTIIPVHGTWSSNSTWGDLSGIRRASKNLFGDQHLGSSYQWSGGNFAVFRSLAAAGLVIQARNEIKSESFNGQITLVGHSHGGNVAIEALNLMADMDVFKGVSLNLVTINTPVRDDYQLSENASKRVNHVNVYDTEDPIQTKGGDDITLYPPNPIGLNLPSTEAPWGEYGSAARTFTNAKNIVVRNPQSVIEKWILAPGPFNLRPIQGDYHNSHNRVGDWIDQTVQ